MVLFRVFMIFARECAHQEALSERECIVVHDLCDRHPLRSAKTTIAAVKRCYGCKRVVVFI